MDDDLADSLPLGRARAGEASGSQPASTSSRTAARRRLGDHIALDDLAATLETIAAGGPGGFYEGPVARKIVDAVQAAGGRMTMDDLAHYRAVEREPVAGTYRGHEIVSMPPPSSGGAHIIEILNILEGYPTSRAQGLNSAASHARDGGSRKARLRRPRAMARRSRLRQGPVEGARLRRPTPTRCGPSISLDRARPAADIRPGEPQRYESDQTTHFSIVDADGNAVSNTYTLNFSYGSGLVADGTGVLLNNELDDFAAKPGAANAYGLMGGDANAPGPNKRPLSSMSPTIVLKDGKVELVTGSPGGSRIITTVLQIIVDVIDHGLNVAEAESAPRAHDQLYPDELQGRARHVGRHGPPARGDGPQGRASARRWARPIRSRGLRTAF